MQDEKNNQSANTSQNALSFIALGGLEDVTRNMYLYEYKDQILIVDCGLGFPDETMLGVDLLLPDITYLLKTDKKIVGMLLSHGHEDHIGGLPYILPQLPKFPIYASPFTTALANEKLGEYNLPRSVQQVNWGDKEIKLGDFSVKFIRITHSVPDSTNIFITSPAGNFFHGSDFKFDLTPADGKRTDFPSIAKASEEGILGLMSDCLGAERPGHTPSEAMLTQNFEREMRESDGKVIITTYSSNISRLNQAIAAAERVGRKVCFVGRSIVKTKEVAARLGYLHIKGGTEVQLQELKNYKPSQLVFLVAGSQGQENSAMTRIAAGEHREIGLDPLDVVILSSDTIPGNELAVSALIDMIVKRGARVVYSTATEAFHVSGHGSSGDHMLLIALTQPKYLLPISGTYQHMWAYKNFAQKMGYRKNDIFLIENGQEMIFSKDGVRFGKKIAIKNIYVDEVSGGELENFVIRDREKLAKEGIIIVLAEVNASDGQLTGKPEIISRGSAIADTQGLSAALLQELQAQLSQHKEKVHNWVHIRRLIGDIAQRLLSKKFRTRPLVLPVVIEV